MTKYTKRLIQGLLLAATFSILIAGAQSNQVKVGQMVMNIPANWYQTTVPSDEPYTRAVLASNSKANDQALMMLSVIPKNGRSLESVNSATRNYIATKMDGTLEFERSSNIGGAPAHTFVYEGRSEHSQQGRRKFMRTIVAKDNSFYILHGIADHVPFANYAGTMENMVNSVKWSN